MSENTRKAVITTAQVQDALNGYTTILAELSGTENATLEFDKGARGKGFAVYNKAGDVVDTFETKEDAYVKFTTWVTVAEEVVKVQAERKAREDVESKSATRKTATKAVESAAA